MGLKESRKTSSEQPKTENSSATQSAVLNEETKKLIISLQEKIEELEEQSSNQGQTISQLQSQLDRANAINETLNQENSQIQKNILNKIQESSSQSLEQNLQEIRNSIESLQNSKSESGLTSFVMNKLDSWNQAADRQNKEKENEYNRILNDYQNKTERLTKEFQNRTEGIIKGVKSDVDTYALTAKDEIKKSVKVCTKEMKEISDSFQNSFADDRNKFLSEMRKMRIPYLLKTSFIVVLGCAITLALTLVGYNFIKSYANSKVAAETARTDERLEFEEWKSEQEAEIENGFAELEAEANKMRESNTAYLEAEKNKIARDAVEKYKNSNDFVIDGATFVANNFHQLRILETMYQEMPIQDKKDLGLHKFLSECHRDYKEKFGKTSPREL